MKLRDQAHAGNQPPPQAPHRPRADQEPTAQHGAEAHPSGRTIDRRSFVKRGALATGAAALTLGSPEQAAARALRLAGRRRSARHGGGERPNILVILVDQLRSPTWMPAEFGAAQAMPNLTALRERSVVFERHYTAANDCSPSRAVLLTGLYAHQTGVMITGSGWLDPRFPTWGGLLGDIGYETAYFGKWHINPDANASLEQYGFAGGTYPSPNGSPGQGTGADPPIADQAIEWLDNHNGKAPFALTASFVNPHDIAWWHRFTDNLPTESNPPARASSLPANFETPEELAAKGKPLLQRTLQQIAAQSFGAVPFSGPEALRSFTQMMDTYLLLQGYVDEQIGRLLQALAERPRLAANTVVLFTSDHGEYGGSHGLRGKGAAVYEEALRVPLYIHDPRGALTKDAAIPRMQLTSSADITPLLLSIAHGSQSWRRHPAYAHLAHRPDLLEICRRPAAPGRRWVLHTTDEDVTEFASEPYAASAPRHVIALRTQHAKLAIYTNWRDGSTQAEAAGQEFEFYDYSSAEGRLELSDQAAAAANPLFAPMRSTLEEVAIPRELHAPLPSRLRKAQRAGLAAYLRHEAEESFKVAEYHGHRAGESPGGSSEPLTAQPAAESPQTLAAKRVGRPSRSSGDGSARPLR